MSPANVYSLAFAMNSSYEGLASKPKLRGDAAKNFSEARELHRKPSQHLCPLKLGGLPSELLSARAAAIRSSPLAN